MECVSNKHAFVFMFCLVFLTPHVCSQLYYNFYIRTCPNLNRIVKNNILSAISNDSRIAASLLRLHFHDCFVNVIKSLDFSFLQEKIESATKFYIILFRHRQWSFPSKWTEFYIIIVVNLIFSSQTKENKRSLNYLCFPYVIIIWIYLICIHDVKLFTLSINIPLDR